MDKLLPNNPIGKTELNRLREAAGKGPVLIVTHDSPDPDALSSGEGLAALFERAWQIPSRLIYSGLVARAENKAMLRHVARNWQYARYLTDVDDFSAVVLVDTQPGAGNNSLPAHVTPDIVIDHHHPRLEGLEQVTFVDVRPEVGATVTIVYQYLAAAGIQPDQQLATAMFYGLQTDTTGLARGASTVDELVYVQLLSWVDRDALIKIEQAGLSRDYFRAFVKGLQAATLYGRVIVANLGQMQRPDMPAEMADVLLRLEGAEAVLCLGEHEKIIYLSLRTKNAGQDAGLIIQRIITDRGKAGGHGSMAGGQTPLKGRAAPEVVEEIQNRFLAVMNEKGSGERLLAE